MLFPEPLAPTIETYSLAIDRDVNAFEDVGGGVAGAEECDGRFWRAREGNHELAFVAANQRGCWVQ